MKYEDTISLIKHLTRLTACNYIIWNSELSCGNICYYTTIPETNIEIKLYNTDTIPDIFISTGKNIKKEILKDMKFINQTIHPAESAAIELAIHIVSQNNKSINNGIEMYLTTF